jgi:HTH-type transcriptional regulator/antitoxin HigA
MIKHINNEDEYNEALDRLEELWNALPGTPEAKELNELIVLIDAYEMTCYNSKQGQQSSFNFHPFDPDEVTPEDPISINDLLNQWDKEIDADGNVKKNECGREWNREKYCNCFIDNPKESWALGKKFFICKNCNKEIYHLSEGEGI